MISLFQTNKNRFFSVYPDSSALTYNITSTVAQRIRTVTKALSFTNTQTELKTDSSRAVCVWDPVAVSVWSERVCFCVCVVSGMGQRESDKRGQGDG